MRTRQVDDKLRGAQAPRRDGRLLARGADHHPQHHRVARHRDRRLRLEGGRRGGDGGAGLRRDARHVRAAGAAPRHGQPRRLAADGPAVRRRDRAALRERDHAEDAAADGLPHGQHHRPDPAGAEDRGHGARPGRAGDGRRRARLRPPRLHDSRPRLRLLRRLPPQVARRPSAPASSTCGATASRSCGRSTATAGVADDDIREAEPHRHASGAHRPRHQERHRLPREHRHRAQGGAAALPAELLDEPGARPAAASCSTRPPIRARSCAIANVGVARHEAGGPGRRRCSSSTGSGRSRSTPRACTACASRRTSSPRPPSSTRSCGRSRSWPPRRHTWRAPRRKSA